MIPASEALDKLLALVGPLEPERVPLGAAAGRVLARDAVARRMQPPFDASAMDGYAIRSADLRQGAKLRVIGEAPAGGVFDGLCGAGEAVRIFTGAPVPAGADHVVIQEHVTRDGDLIRIETPGEGDTHIRRAGSDFAEGNRLPAPRLLSPADIALLAAMSLPTLPVTRRPVVALIATGDELVQPGELPGPGQIIASNSYGLQALLRAAGAETRMLPIVPDRLDALTGAFERASDSDLVVSIGGASVGDHDLVAQAMDTLGIERAFYKIAMRPGKPLMAGRFGNAAMVGLPGNPVSAMVCATLFLKPMVAKMLGLPAGMPATRRLPLTAPVGANGPRAHYMRARLEGTGIAPFANQDSAILSLLAEADSLILRQPHDPARNIGDLVDVIEF